MLAVVGVIAIETRVGAVTVRTTKGLVTLPEVAVMLETPTLRPVAKPPLAIVAVAVLDEVHVTEEVTFCVEPLEKVPIAVNCWLAPTPILGLVGVTAIEVSVAGVTTKDTVGLVMPFTVAVIPEVPILTPVARPVLTMVATAVLEEAQVAVDVKFCVVPSEKVPVAVNCCVSPTRILGLAGVTATEVRTATPTFKEAVLLVKLPKVALMFVEPTARPVARPPALIVATLVFEEAQVTEEVKSCVEPSL
jgi:hypothetical protein